MSTITICIGGHGSTTAVRTRSDGDIHYPPGFKLNFLGIAGRANIQTQVGLVYEREDKDEQDTLISSIKKHDKYNLFKSDVLKKIKGLGTDYLTLSYLVPNIFRGKTINNQDESLNVMEKMEPEMRALAMLADIKYSESSPPEIFKNEPIKKMWWFDDNPGDNLRGLDREGRSAPSRAAGETKYNPILAINGLFILHTTNDDHSKFSISNITEPHEFDHSLGVSLITYEAIRRRNLLRKINYTSYWKKFIDAYDFSEVLDEDVLEIGSITEAVFIVKQIYYAFQSENATDNSTEDKLGVVEEDPIVNDGYGEPVDEYSKTPRPPSQLILKQLTNIIREHAGKASDLFRSIKTANDTVQSLRAPFLKGAEAADGKEKQIEELKLEILLRSVALKIDELTKELADADIVLDKQRIQLTKAMEESAQLESELVRLQYEIVTNVRKFIRDLISPKKLSPKKLSPKKLSPKKRSRDVDDVITPAIKNIIMRNKLKNILKFGIYHKRLSLRQLVLFFRSLGYNIINIVDPSCFVLKPPRTFKMDIDTQNLPDSLSGTDPDKVDPHPHWTQQFKELERDFKDDDIGGTKRKKSKCSRKRRTRRKRCVTRRYRRRRS